MTIHNRMEMCFSRSDSKLRRLTADYTLLPVVCQWQTSLGSLQNSRMMWWRCLLVRRGEVLLGGGRRNNTKHALALFLCEGSL